MYLNRVSIIPSWKLNALIARTQNWSLRICVNLRLLIINVTVMDLLLGSDVETVSKCCEAHTHSGDVHGEFFLSGSRATQ